MLKHLAHPKKPETYVKNSLMGSKLHKHSDTE